MKQDQTQDKSDRAREKQRKLDKRAEALRANLKRRKDQVRESL